MGRFLLYRTPFRVLLPGSPSPLFNFPGAVRLRGPPGPPLLPAPARSFFYWLLFRLWLWDKRRRQRRSRPFCSCEPCHGVQPGAPMIDRSDQAALDTACREGRLEWAYAEVRLEDDGGGHEKSPRREVGGTCQRLVASHFQSQRQRLHVLRSLATAQCRRLGSEKGPSTCPRAR